MDFGGFLAPQVLPGTYSVKLKVGDRELQDQIILIHRDEKNYTLDDRKLQYEAGMKYFKMHEDLAKTVDDINREQKLIKESKEKFKSKNQKKLLINILINLKILDQHCWLPNKIDFCR